jgi:hypothetical protein
VWGETVDQATDRIVARSTVEGVHEQSPTGKRIRQQVLKANSISSDADALVGALSKLEQLIKTTPDPQDLESIRQLQDEINDRMKPFIKTQSPIWTVLFETRPKKRMVLLLQTITNLTGFGRSDPGRIPLVIRWSDKESQVEVFV